MKPLLRVNASLPLRTIFTANGLPPTLARPGQYLGSIWSDQDVVFVGSAPDLRLSDGAFNREHHVVFDESIVAVM
jgi:hypothetical protein